MLHMVTCMVADKVAGGVADQQNIGWHGVWHAGPALLADKEVAELADMVAGHEGWLIGPNSIRSLRIL